MSDHSSLFYQNTGWSQEESSHAKVPLRSHANENSFFGSEGLDSAEAQNALGVKYPAGDHATTLDKQLHDQLEMYHSPCEFTSSVLDKENYLFSVHVDMDYPFLTGSLHQSHHQSHEKEMLTPIMEQSSYFEQSNQGSAVPDGNIDNFDAECINLVMQDSPVTSIFSSSSSLEDDLFSESSVYEVPVKRRRSITFKATPPPVYAIVDTSQVDECGGQVITKAPRWEGDLYTPQLQRGKGDWKEGYCSLCKPGIWLRIKQSSYWYHMNYHHGINAATGKSYDPPSDYRLERIACSENGGNGSVLLRVNGVCGVCGTEVAISSKYLEEEENTEEFEDIVDMQTLSLMAWYKHAQRCHKSK